MDNKKHIENINNMKNMENMNNINNIENMNNMKNIENMNNMKNIENMNNINNIENINNMKNIQNINNIENMDNMNNTKYIENMDNMNNIENMNNINNYNKIYDVNIINNKNYDSTYNELYEKDNQEENKNICNDKLDNSINEKTKYMKTLREYFVKSEKEIEDQKKNNMNDMYTRREEEKIKDNEDWKLYDFKNLKEKYKFQMNMKDSEINQLQNNLIDEFKELNEVSKLKNNLKGKTYNSNIGEEMLEENKEKQHGNYVGEYFDRNDMILKERIFEYAKHKTSIDMLKHPDDIKRNSKDLKKWKSQVITKKYADDWLSSDVLLSCFLNFIKLKKYVNITELSVKFQTTTDDIREKLEELEEQDMINGVLDEKGNYIYLSQEEINKLCFEIQSKGKVNTHDDFVKICNKVISLSVNDKDMEKLKEEEEKIIKAKTEIF
ncbi:hypothetical protein PFBG_03379 [Plasmodium falciparum 7G8]|nr:hypothetical protein PFBG_03379 [Plasmodium falciparum 7G8]